MKSLYLLLIAVLVAILGGCEESKMPLPSPRTVSTSFGANDTSYVELNPVWNSAQLGLALAAPGDLTIGADGTLFLADEGAGRIYALNRAGQVLSGYGLDQIALPAPRALAMDSKLNLFMVNGTNRLFIWNQYLNRISIDSVAEAGVYFDRESHQEITLTFAQLRQRVAAGGSAPMLRRYLFYSDPERIAAAKAVYPVWQDPEASAQYNGVAAGKYGQETVYVTESATDRILQLLLVPDLALKGRERTVLFHYTAELQTTVAVYGSGSGTVDDPWAITTDSDENLYFTQLRGNFRVQKLAAGTFIPRYILYQHAIMDLDRFQRPFDLALDGSGNIFVLDNGTGTVSKFGNAGARAGQLLPLGKKGLALAAFSDGRGILVSDDVVYVVERGTKSLRRFQYSVSESDLPDDEKNP
ncbi:MAG TPA: hypothetical protein PLG50_10255 [bacterium]|nr:hypothetical protein [bacterium]HQG46029.1 hypothetical protein [bacterium]HQI47106.1 hypothetical protein [bacterium]HQJ63176.1 hypothetical protein [bacterium]